MSAAEILAGIMQRKLWVNNRSEMGRVQCAKLICSECKLKLVLSSDASTEVVLASISKILVLDNEISVFYDGLTSQVLKLEDYKKYGEYIAEDEWSMLFEEDSSRKLWEMNLFLENERFIFDVHENIGWYEEKYNVVESLKLNETSVPEVV